MKTLITTLLFATTTIITYAAININSVNYDINIQFEEDKYVENWSYEPNTRTYYEVLEVTAQRAGTYNFYNYNSDLLGLFGPTQDTQLLIYDVVPDFVIIDRPWAFNNGLGEGFGGGQGSHEDFMNPTPIEQNITEKPKIAELTLDPTATILDLPVIQPEPITLLPIVDSDIFGSDPFDATITFSAGQSYTVVFSSFQPDAFGSMDVRIQGPSELGISAIPEPATYALIAGFLAFLYIAIKSRNKV